MIKSSRFSSSTADGSSLFGRFADRRVDDNATEGQVAVLEIAAAVRAPPLRERRPLRVFIIVPPLREFRSNTDGTRQDPSFTKNAMPSYLPNSRRPKIAGRTGGRQWLARTMDYFQWNVQQGP